MLDKKRWYHRFSALTARAGSFHLERDVRTGHGPLGALYPTNTGVPSLFAYRRAVITVRP